MQIIGSLLLMSLLSVAIANRVYVHPFGMFALENVTCEPVQAHAEKPLELVTPMVIEPHEGIQPDARAIKDSESQRQNFTSRTTVLAYLQNVLGLRLYDTLKKQTGTNILFSPVSAYGALVTFYLGASGKTAKELQVLLGLGKETDTEDCISPFDGHKVLNTLHSINALAGPTDELRTQVWTFVRRNMDLSEDFVKGTQDFSNASYIRAVDLSQPSEAVAQVNSFIRRTSAGKIKHLFQDISPSSSLLFATSFDFQWTWRTAFQLDITSPQEFWINDNTSIIVPLMTSTGNYKYLDDRGRKCTIVKLPLSNQNYMLLILPHKGTELEHMEKQPTAELISEWAQNLQDGLLQVSVPQFSMRAVSDLHSILSDLKLSSLLGKEAEFRRLSTKDHITIGQVLNMVLFEMSEEGPADQDKPQGGAAVTKITVNRPFFFTIVEGNSDAILLVGRITDPSL